MFKFSQTKKKKGQSTLEYAVLIVVVLAALIVGQSYVKRAQQGSLMDSADRLGEQGEPGGSNITRTSVSHSRTQDNFGSGKHSLVTLDASTNTTNNKVLVNIQRTFWPR